MKTNAKEYLKEFAGSQQDWLKALIYDAIETNGNITNERKNKIFKHLTDDADLSVTEPNISHETLESEIYITKLVHKAGVNALKEEQTIKFTNDVTILYGLNGAGKSSYFKVLNEIVGGNQKKEILANIYTETPKSIAIELSFKKREEQDKTINWNGSPRSLDLLNKCKVFDTSYLNGLLETRKADSTLIQPLGLNLFTYLVELVDRFKEEVEKKANQKKLEKPTLELGYLNDVIKSSFEKHQVSKEVKKQIEYLFVFSDDNSQKLSKTKRDLLDLKQINIQDKIKLKNTDKTDIKSIITHIKNTNRSLSNHSENIESAINEHLKNQKANNTAKERFEILSTIPANDTDEWKEFIKAGKTYSSKITDTDNCIYCLQPLKDDNSINLIKAYSNYLQDESEQNLIKSTNKLTLFKTNLEKITVTKEITESAKENLEAHKINLFNEVSNMISSFSSTQKSLLQKIEKQDVVEKYTLLDNHQLLNELKKITDAIQTEVDGFSAEDTRKKENIALLEIQQKQLLENKSISEQKEAIKKWFDIDTAENELIQKAREIKTTTISNLSKTAHNYLLTETLKTIFSDELSGLGYEDLDIKIESARGQKGTSSTKLTLTKNNDIKAILSEGEQKAVALALFIAEAKIQKNINPIILDDPVNSLDHKIAGNFANRLLQLDNQIILFNHNRLFLDAFETSKENHVCKTIDTDCSKSKGKHIRIYQVNSEGKNAKGVLLIYKSNKAEKHISEANNLLNKSPFENELKVAILLRKTVECIIDEVIFNNQLPTKYSNKNSRIAWGELKKIKNDSDTIDKLKTIHGRVSSGEMHNGTENEENPIDVEGFQKMITDLNNILNPSVQ